MDASGFFEELFGNFTHGIDSFQSETGKGAEFFMTFLREVDWTQPWLLALVAFHIFCMVFIILTRRHVFTMQVPLFALLFMLCAPASYINQWAAENYKYFASDQYFDSSGLFITLVYCTPMMINAVLILICMLLETAQMVVTVKRAELKQKQRQEQKSNSQQKKPESKKKR